MKKKNSYKRNYNKTENDPIFNTMIYQIIIVAIMIAFLIYAKQSPFKLFNDFVANVKDYATVSIDKNVFTDYYENIKAKINKIFSEEDETLNGRGGKPNKINNKVDIPNTSTLSPIIVSVPVSSPVNGRITSNYGVRIHPITNENDFHTGIDIAAKENTSILSVLDGTVIDIGFSNFYGNYITIKHCRGFVSTYCHCNKILAKVGANIKQGERIALVGSTGISTGPHLHFEIKYNGITYDPMWVLKEK